MKATAAGIVASAEAAEADFRLLQARYLTGGRAFGYSLTVTVAPFVLPHLFLAVPNRNTPLWAPAGSEQSYRQVFS